MTEPSIAARILALQKLNVEELRVRWKELTGEETTQRNRAYLLKRCAWEMQRQHFGGELSPEAKQRLYELQAEFRENPPETWFRGAKHHRPPTSSTPKRPAPVRDANAPKPGTVLARRPDVSAAQAAVMAAQARVGVAQTAWFPAITLTGNAGHASPELGDLFKWSARAWGVSALLSLPLWDGVQRDAQVQGANARLEQALASHREQVLTAFREVEDQLASLRWLSGPQEQGDVVAGPPVSEPAPALEAGAPARILLADDNADMRDYVGRVLKQLEEQRMIDVSGKTIVILGTR